MPVILAPKEGDGLVITPLGSYKIVGGKLEGTHRGFVDLGVVDMRTAHEVMNFVQSGISAWASSYKAAFFVSQGGLHIRVDRGDGYQPIDLSVFEYAKGLELQFPEMTKRLELDLGCVR